MRAVAALQALLPVALLQCNPQDRCRVLDVDCTAVLLVCIFTSSVLIRPRICRSHGHWCTRCSLVNPPVEEIYICLIRDRTLIRHM
jgi:hypothetical protein